METKAQSQAMLGQHHDTVVPKKLPAVAEAMDLAYNSKGEYSKVDSTHLYLSKRKTVLFPHCRKLWLMPHMCAFNKLSML